MAKPIKETHVSVIDEADILQEPEDKDIDTSEKLENQVRKEILHTDNPKEEQQEEVIHLNLNDFYLTMSDVERAFCFGYTANPDNNCLDNVEMMRRWQAFKDIYLNHKILE